MRHISYVLIVAALLSSCGVCHKCYLATTETKDTVIVKEAITIKDTVIQYTPPDSSQNTSSNIQDTVIAETQLAQAKAWIQNDSLKLTLRNKTETLIPIKTTIRDKVRTETRIQINNHTRTIEVNKLTTWQKFILGMGYVFVGVILAAITGLCLKLKSKTI